MHSPTLAYIRSQTKRPIALATRGLSKTLRSARCRRARSHRLWRRVLCAGGPNGAGKATTLRMVVGLLRPDAGTIAIEGINALADPTAGRS
jgi:ABC-2 type transport system ATP-binding protein